MSIHGRPGYDTAHGRSGFALLGGSTLSLGLKAYYAFEEAAAPWVDAVGGFNLTGAGGSSTVGKHNNACAIANGGNLSNASCYTFGAGGVMSMAGWIRQASVTTGNAGQYGTNIAFVGLSGLSIYGSYNGTLTSMGTLGASNTRFIVMWVDPGDSLLRLSISNAAPLVSAGPITPTQPTTFSFRNTGTRPLGMWDEVGFWDRMLTSDERTALYNNNVGLFYPF